MVWWHVSAHKLPQPPIGSAHMGPRWGIFQLQHWWICPKMNFWWSKTIFFHILTYFDFPILKISNDSSNSHYSFAKYAQPGQFKQNWADTSYRKLKVHVQYKEIYSPRKCSNVVSKSLNLRYEKCIILLSVKISAI